MVNSLQNIDVNHLETIPNIDLKALYIIDLLKFGIKPIVVKLRAFAAVGISAEMQFLACCVSLGISVLRMRILNFVLCTSYNRVIFDLRAAQQLPISLVCNLNLLWAFPGL